MKKILFITVAAILLVTASFSLLACGEGECEHTWGDWVVGRAATCGEDGYSIRSCTKCGEQGRRTDRATNHSFAEHWTTSNTHHWHDITCGHSVAASALYGYGEHEFIDNVCAVCGAELVTQGLSYEPNLGEQTVSVSNIGNANSTVVHIGIAYNINNSRYPIVGVKASAFRGLKGLVGVYMRNNIISIGDRAFAGCTDLSYIQLAYVDTTDRNENLDEGELPVYQTLGVALFDGSSALETIRFSGTKEQWAELTARCHGWDFGMPEGVSVICDDGEGVSAVTEHTLGEWRVVKDATCSVQGRMERSCYCGYTESMPVETVDHTFIFSGWQNDRTNHWKVASCTSCGHSETVELDEHDFVSHTCIVCDITTVTQGLDYKGILGTGTYLVEGIGDALDQNIIIGVRYSGSPIVGIADGAFENTDGLLSVFCQSNITSVGDSAFSGCADLAEVRFDSAELTLGSSVFDGCTSLSWIVFGGTYEQWLAITEANPDWSNGLDHKVYVHCTDGDKVAFSPSNAE
ncbi:MAG: leucine-rich repeat protein [Clostridia bacterium]|nr:leucine-rich repeat protein [Clostridia bacterium]